MAKGTYKFNGREAIATLSPRRITQVHITDVDPPIVGREYSAARHATHLPVGRAHKGPSSHPDKSGTTHHT